MRRPLIFYRTVQGRGPLVPVNGHMHLVMEGHGHVLVEDHQGQRYVEFEFPPGLGFIPFGVIRPKALRAIVLEARTPISVWME